MEFSQTTRDDVMIVTIKGNITIVNRDQLRGVLDGFIKSNYVKIVLDGGSLGYVDSSGLGVLSIKVKKFKELGGNITFANLSEVLQHELELTRLDQFFNVYDSVEEAVASFKPELTT